MQNQKLKIPKNLEGHVLRLQKEIDYLHEKIEEEILIVSHEDLINREEFYQKYDLILKLE